MSSQPAGLPHEFADRFTKPLRRFLKIESAAGALLLLTTVAAMVLANSPLGTTMSNFWSTSTGFRFGSHEFVRTVRHWINDGLMTGFFFVVALELKRELTRGELHDLRKATFPLAGALGGMIVPPLVYLALLHSTPAAHGWGTAMTTDTAFVLGVLAVLGDRVPASLRLFLLSLAIFDDVGAILVVAVAYGGPLRLMPLAVASSLVVAILVASRAGIRSSLVYLVAGATLWLAVDASGIHPSVAGVLLGLMTPSREWVSGERLHHILERVTAQPTESHRRDAAERDELREAGVAAKEAVSPVERLELRVHPWSGFLVMPLFALANAGVSWSWEKLAQPLSLGIAVALVLGKPLGVMAALGLAVRARVVKRPAELSWPVIVAASILTGIGFTMSIFIANLAFEPATVEVAKMGILMASTVAGVLGLGLLLVLTSPREAGARAPLAPRSA